MIYSVYATDSGFYELAVSDAVPDLGYPPIFSKGPSWIYGLCDSGMVRAPDATVLVIRILTSMWILVLVLIYTKGHIYTFMQI